MGEKPREVAEGDERSSSNHETKSFTYASPHIAVHQFNRLGHHIGRAVRYKNGRARSGFAWAAGYMEYVEAVLGVGDKQTTRTSKNVEKEKASRAPLHGTDVKHFNYTYTEEDFKDIHVRGKKFV